MKGNNVKKIMSFLSSLVLVVSLFAGTPILANAAGTGNNDQQQGDGKEGSQYTADVRITKDLAIPDGVASPAVTFTFKFTKLGVEDSNMIGNVVSGTASDCPTIADVSLAYLAGELSTGGNNYIRQQTANVLSAITAQSFDHAGVFVYDITELRNPDITEVDNITYSKASYRLKIYVKNVAATAENPKGLEITGVTVNKDVNDAGTDLGNGEKVDPGPGDDKYGLKFVNTYANLSALEITKTVTGDYADKTKDFNFNATFKFPGTIAENTTYKGVVVDNTGNPVSPAQSVTVTVNASGQGTAPFTLKDGQKLVFDGVTENGSAKLPVGTTYTVTETGVPGYTPSAVVTENGTAASIGGNTTQTGTKGANFTPKGAALVPAGSNDILVGEGANKTAFTNKYHDMSVTGVLIDNLPFIMLIVVAVLGLLFFAVSRRNRRSR